MNINVNVEKKIARVTGAPVIICGNSGYNLTFTFDEEWDNLPDKTARFSWYKNGEKLFTDVDFRGHTVEAPVMADITEVFVGVFAGSLKTTTPARIMCERSILCGEGAKMLKGPTGDAATISVGTVTTTAPGTEAEVENVGTKQNAVFNFKIPQGPAGEQGEPGPGGEAATIEVGEVIAVEPDAEAEVENVGTTSKAVFNFKIPRGQPGDTTTVGEVVLTDDQLAAIPNVTLTEQQLRVFQLNGLVKVVAGGIVRVFILYESDDSGLTLQSTVTTDGFLLESNLSIHFATSTATLTERYTPLLPEVNGTDSGKFLTVNASGQWVATEIPSAEESSF